ncbi:MAG: Flagellar L-ring protein precursor [Deltaproteobacteria bacterium ADurb.Bin510]|nr:MAG: Flagellar L-ring protein precursor [Deltaproteobacteria bacterium ADurb.Bin510]
MQRSALMILTILSLTAGCAAHRLPPQVNLDRLAEPVDQQVIDEVVAPGSLWTPSGRMVDIYAGQQAKRVGDLVIVQIDESSSAEKEAKTDSSRSNSMKGGVTSFLGLPLDKASIFGNSLEPTIELSTTNSFTGDGKTSRKGDLTGTVTARITRVLPTGNLLLEGKKQIRINAEVQYIMLTGIIRPEDITPSNTVLSTKIADLQVDYYGSGVIGDQQRKGYLARAIDKAWPF